MTTINEILRKALIGKKIGPIDSEYAGWQIANVYGEENHPEIILEVEKAPIRDHIILNFDEEFDLV